MRDRLRAALYDVERGQVLDDVPLDELRLFEVGELAFVEERGRYRFRYAATIDTVWRFDLSETELRDAVDGSRRVVVATRE